MKNTKIYIYIALLAGSFSACTYLDIVPDMIATVEKNAFSMRAQAEKFFFTCYGYLPGNGNYTDDPALLGGDELWMTETGAAWAGGATDARNLSMGNQQAANPYYNYWAGGRGVSTSKDLYQGISDCNIFLENIGRVPDMTFEERNEWIAEVDVIKAWLHYLLVRAYGPIPIKDVNLSVKDDTELTKVYRNTMDECVEYCVGKIDNVLQREHLMVNVQTPQEQYGRITKGVALMMKAKMLVTFASPLYNGNRDYIGLRDNRGIEIFNPQKTPDEQKALWQRAADACWEAIEFFNNTDILTGGNKPELYRFTGSSVLGGNLSTETIQKLTIRGSLVDRASTDVIWADTRNWTSNYQRQSYPRDFDTNLINNTGVRNNLAVPIKIAELFYTKNGLPITEDESWNYDERFNTGTIDASHQYYMEVGQTGVNFFMNREPRLYGSLGFDRGIWFSTNLPNAAEVSAQGRFIHARAGEYTLNHSDQSVNRTAIWPKKVVHWDTAVTTNSGTAMTIFTYAWPTFRLPDLYLMYAEAINEADNTAANRAEAIVYLDKIRARAGLQGVVETWTSAVSKRKDKHESQIGLREIIRQERMIELMFEGHRFWDIRRWKIAVNEYEKPMTGWSLNGRDAAEFYKESLVFNRKFYPREYLWPIPTGEILRNSNTVQNYGW